MANRELTKEEKHAKLTELVAELYNTVGPGDVLFKNSEEGVWYLGEKKLVPQQLLQFAQEAEIIKRMGIWKEINLCLKYLSNRQMFLKAKGLDDMIGGKLLLFYLKNVDDILEKAIKLAPKAGKK